MKKAIIILLAAIVLLAAGFTAGCKATISAPKWVEEEAGMYIICTEFAGHVFTDVADKATHHYNAFVFAVGRR